MLKNFTELKKKKNNLGDPTNLHPVLTQQRSAVAVWECVQGDGSTFWLAEESLSFLWQQKHEYALQ